MSPVLVALGAVVLVGTTGVVLAAWGRIRYARELPSLRCRVGPPASSRRHHARWCLRRTRAAWVDDVLFAPVRRAAAVAGGRGRPGVTVQALEPGEGRGLGGTPSSCGSPRTTAVRWRSLWHTRTPACWASPSSRRPCPGSPRPRARGAPDLRRVIRPG